MYSGEWSNTLLHGPHKHSLITLENRDSGPEGMVYTQQAEWMESPASWWPGLDEAEK